MKIETKHRSKGKLSYFSTSSTKKGETEGKIQNLKRALWNELVSNRTLQATEQEESIGWKKKNKTHYERWSQRHNWSKQEKESAKKIATLPLWFGITSPKNEAFLGGERLWKKEGGFQTKSWFLLWCFCFVPTRLWFYMTKMDVSWIRCRFFIWRIDV